MGRKIKIGVLHEQIILGSMLVNRKVRKRLTKQLHAGEFAAPRHRAIFAALQELEEQGLDYIPVTLKSFLPPSDQWGGVEYLKELEDKQSDENIEHHLQRARWDTARATIINEHLSEFEAALKDPRLEIEEGLSLLHKIEDKLKAARGNSAIVPGMAIAAKYEATLYAREDPSRLCTTGYLPLDHKLTDPFGRGKITVIYAAPSIGKTTFALNMAQRQARNWKVGYLAWESGNVAATDIVVSSSLGIPLDKLIKNPNTLTNKERSSISELLERIYTTTNNLSFLKPPKKNIYENSRGPWEINDRVIDWFESHLEDWGRDIIFWDLFTKKLPDRRPDAMSWALDRIQEIAERYGVHIALLHQPNKELEKQKDKRPTRAHLKGTGGWLEVADVIFGLYRRAIYNPGIEDNEFEIYCLKQRIGFWPWRMIMDWEGPKCRITGGREVQITVYEDEDEDFI